MTVYNPSRNCGAYGPFYFGTATQPLYGYYHPPLTAEARGCSVILCSPVGHEYLNSHRAFRQLAMHLSTSGFPVLRFDFSGCGDSGGEFAQGGLAHWVTDIAMAVEEMKARSGIETVCLIGLRLGGTLSILTSVQRSDITYMVLWDPVVNGRTYLTQLQSLTHKTLAYLLTAPLSPKQGKHGLELMGFLYTTALLDDLRKIDLYAIREMKAHHILLLEHGKNAGAIPLMQHFKGCGISTEYQSISNPRDWLDKPYKALVPTHILTAITNWMARRVA